MLEKIEKWANGLFTRQERLALIFILVVTVSGLLILAWRRARPVPAAAWIRLQVQVNTAGAEELAGLPGIGPTLAGRIVQDRRRRGPFLTLKDLLRVKGMTPKLLDRLRGKVRFDQGE